jgi:trk system potassium uptake protein
MSQTKYIIIVGCGRLGSVLANDLSQKGHNVVVIDVKRANFKLLSLEFSGFQIAGDASELAILRQAKIEKADSFFAVTGNDNLNLMVAQIAKVIFKVPKVLARIFDPAREVIYQDFSITAISPVKLSVQVFLDSLENSTKLET